MHMMKAMSLLLLTSALACLQADAAVTATFYVAQNGKDTWSGRQARPGFFRTDGPFATVPRALSAARAFRRGVAWQGAPVTIMVGKGNYFLGETLRLLREDSGLTLTGEGVISGGVQITNWWAGSVNGRTALMASVPKGFVFHQLWVNGTRATPARHPNTNYFWIDSIPDKTESWLHGQSRFGFKEGEVPAWKDIDPEAKAVVMCRWVESHLPIKEINAEERTIRFRKKTVFQLEPNDPWYLEGLMDALDNTGEWCLDSRKGVVYYLPRHGEAPGSIVAIAPRLTELLRLECGPGASNVTSSIRIKGLTFSHTEHTYPAPKDENDMPSGGSVQAAVAVPAAVRAVGLQNSVFEKCRFMNLGTYALELAEGCRSNLVKNCEFSDLGAGGIKIGTGDTNADMPSDNQVVQCRVFDGGKVFHSAVGIWIGQSPNNIIAQNEIFDFYYTGISAGWTWGYGASLATNLLVISNHVHHIGVKSNGDGPILSDMGGIYTLGRQHGTRIVNNLWHDIAGFRYGGWGIYFDEGSSGILAASNIVYNTTHGGFHQHYGATNMVWNNIFAFSRDHQAQRTRPETHSSFSFATNIVFINHGVFLGGNWIEGKLDADHNVYWDTRSGGETNGHFNGKTFEQWRGRGFDTNSIFANPRFRNADAYDFQLAPDSPAIHLGFKPIQAP
jgi:hypothetical protein